MLTISKAQKKEKRARSIVPHKLTKWLSYIGTHDIRHDDRPFLCNCWNVPRIDESKRQYVPYRDCDCTTDSIVTWPLPRFFPSTDGLPLQTLGLFPDIAPDDRTKLNDKIQTKLDAYMNDPQEGDDARKVKQRLQAMLNKAIARGFRHPVNATKTVVGATKQAAETDSSLHAAKLLKAQNDLAVGMDLFTDRARKIYPDMKERDIHRAATNAWPCLCLQILHSKRVDPHDAIVGFSLLYPLTDDILDSPSCDDTAKKSFIKRFGHHVATGEGIAPAAADGSCSTETGPQNQNERKIWYAFSLIERHWPRKHHPALYRALSAL